MWHYTMADRLFRILDSNEIRPRGETVYPGTRPGVWFSVNQTWEPTVTKRLMDLSSGESVRLTSLEMMHAAVGAGRIGVDPSTAPVGWSDWCRSSGVPKPIARKMAEYGNPLHWFVSNEPVRRDKWTHIQVWDGRRWTDDAAAVDIVRKRVAASPPLLEAAVYPNGTVRQYDEQPLAPLVIDLSGGATDVSMIESRRLTSQDVPRPCPSSRHRNEARPWAEWEIETPQLDPPLPGPRYLSLCESCFEVWIGGFAEAVA